MTPYGLNGTGPPTSTRNVTSIPPHRTQPHQQTPTKPFLPFMLSAHAAQRAEQRGISFTPNQKAQFETLLTKLSQKQAKNAFVVFGDKGLIVNVPSRKVITVLDQATMRDKIVTQIDAAAVLPQD